MNAALLISLVLSHPAAEQDLVDSIQSRSTVPSATGEVQCFDMKRVLEAPDVAMFLQDGKLKCREFECALSCESEKPTGQRYDRLRVECGSRTDIFKDDSLGQRFSTKLGGWVNERHTDLMHPNDEAELSVFDRETPCRVRSSIEAGDNYNRAVAITRAITSALTPDIMVPASQMIAFVADDAATAEAFREKVECLRPIIETFATLPPGLPKVLTAKDNGALKPDKHYVALGYCPFEKDAAVTVQVALGAFFPEIKVVTHFGAVPPDSCPKYPPFTNFAEREVKLPGKRVLRAAYRYRDDFIVKDKALPLAKFQVVLTDRKGKVLDHITQELAFPKDVKVEHPKANDLEFGDYRTCEFSSFKTKRSVGFLRRCRLNITPACYDGNAGADYKEWEYVAVGNKLRLRSRATATACFKDD